MTTSEDISSFHAAMDAMTSLTGIERKRILATRRYPLPFYRAMIAKYLRDSRRMTTVDIGNLISRDHSSVSYIIIRLEDVLGLGLYPEIERVWNAFKGMMDAYEADKDPVRIAYRIRPGDSPTDIGWREGFVAGCSFNLSKT